MRGLFLVLWLVGCGGIAPLSIHDPRLSRDARGEIADAEDAVVVSGARLADARERLREAERRAGEGPRLAGDAGARWAEVGAQRAGLARAEVGLGESEVALARARLTLTYAQTAMRHDLAVYELPPLEAEAERRRVEVQRARGRVHELRLQLEETTTGWWSAYRAFVGDGGDAARLWGEAR